ncbi:hypothetical protein [Nitrospina watsonii]|uniref:Uncharacterized protein n=1 Tax=Nitrospina watsonii TaxID=1323948 RepID=A0ABM9HH04_9BACT|nr:hypothetical protein [Nitrospina watsonii]CAI2719516.1 conserved protein of unknown function [Nitrospina watsonii]
MPGFGWNIPFPYITAALFLVFLLAFLVSPFSRHWENILFKTGTALFWAVLALWAIKGIWYAFLNY